MVSQTIRATLSAACLALGLVACSGKPNVDGGDDDGTSRDPADDDKRDEDSNPSGGADGDAATQAGAPSTDQDVILENEPEDDSAEPSSGVFAISPEGPQTVEVALGEAQEALTFEATLSGKPIEVDWSVDRGDVATITLGEAESGTVTSTGAVGGLVVVTAALNDMLVQREVLIELRGSDNGADPTKPGQSDQLPMTEAELTEGGGPGGVGGEGLGDAVEGEMVSALEAPANSGQAEDLRWTYPYAGTVFPRGILAPLVAWDWTFGDADAVRLHLSTDSGSFDWVGTFGRPAILADTSGPFVQHPIPQDVWAAATNTAGGADQLHVELTVLSGDEAYGPIAQSWTIAEARLSGTIYYNSYGTNLAKNLDGAVGGDGRFGGAVLGIRVGDTGPRLVAGATGDSDACRVCHSVSADGSRLVAADFNGGSSNYDLMIGGAVTETPMGQAVEFPGMYPDGTMALSSSGALLPLPDAPMSLPAMGLDTIASNIGTPMFSPDGNRVAFNPTASDTIDNPAQKLLVVDFDADTLTFSNPVEVADYSSEPEETRPGWPAFLPDGQSLVFHRQTEAGADGNGLSDLRTRKGAKAQVFWTNLDGPSSVTLLSRLNGLDADGDSTLPALSAPVDLECTGDGVQVGDIDPSHEDDTNLNYEPTVNPVASGGFAWVVFASRRRYAHVATIPPFCSDPRGVDLVNNITSKKLWVAAVNLNAGPGEDPSHPAFYLPGQELLAGNSRAFWVLDPCRPDGDSCDSGDQCCNGFCQPNDAGELVCAMEPPDHTCSNIQERCEADADCCDPNTRCVGGFCALATPPALK